MKEYGVVFKLEIEDDSSLMDILHNLNIKPIPEGLKSIEAVHIFDPDDETQKQMKAMYEKAEAQKEQQNSN